MAGGGDVGSSVLKANPWPKANPGSADEHKTAYLIDLKMPELRLENERKTQPIGVEICAWGPLYPPDSLKALDTVRAADSFKPGPRERVVDPSGFPGVRVYRKLESAISESEPDDVILIKHTGELKIEPTALTDNPRVKVRPFDDKWHPILVLGTTAEKAATLFHLHHSHVDFENLEFLLRPEARQRWLSVVSMGADSGCRFEQCVFTLDNDNPAVDLDVVTLLDLRESLKTGAESKLTADVKFKACFVRGRGDLVGIKASRPLDLELDSSLVCLQGSLLCVQPFGNEIMPADARCSVRLHKTTTYLTEPALHLAAAKAGRGLILTQLNATSNLFAAGAAAKPLVRLEGLENENQLKKVLAWSGAANAFVGFDRFLEQGGDGGTALHYQNDEWKRFTDAGPDSRFVRAALQVAGGADRAFSSILPNDFPLKSDLAAYGAPLDKLPRPTIEIGLMRY